MKSIKYEEKFLGATGQPFFIPDPDVLLQRAAREEALKEGKAAYEVPQIQATFASLIIWFMDNIPHDGRKLTIQDAGHAYSVIKAFQGVRDGKVELEEPVYEWLLKTIDLDGTTAFRGATAGVLKERVMAVIG